MLSLVSSKQKFPSLAQLPEKSKKRTVILIFDKFNGNLVGIFNNFFCKIPIRHKWNVFYPDYSVKLTIFKRNISSCWMVARNYQLIIFSILFGKKDSRIPITYFGSF